MDNVYVMDNRGSEKLATKVRYFKYNNNSYFVYTLNEVDNEGYVKLYIKKIVGNEDVAIDDNEWPTVKGIVQEVFREIKAGTHYCYEDLDLNKINEIMDTGSRIFRLKQVVVDDILAKKSDINLSDVNDKLINSLKEDKKIDEKDDGSQLPKEENDSRLNSSLLSLLKRVEEVSKEENKFTSPNNLEFGSEIGKMGVESWDTIGPINSVEDQNVYNSDLKSKLKPLIVGNLPIVEYKEKIEKLENEIKAYQDQFFNLKKEFEQIKKENTNLKELLEQSKESFSKYNDKIGKLKDIIESI